jgi:hypothetical protein
MTRAAVAVAQTSCQPRCPVNTNPGT